MMCKSEEWARVQEHEAKAKRLELPGGKENAALECAWKCCMRKFLPITEHESGYAISPLPDPDFLYRQANQIDQPLKYVG
ncbi:hypothetical protein ABEV00_23835 [Paenibacillus thiaminolyticus]|uniref:hypothetical protein n=1 Tax=Paenibacillus TaxID=44249 RepID=UPI00105A0C44|nr:hypothetical protein [Paenibacillus dendritiformis]TDL58050.1 hypothetical protein E2R60_06190 [Paenibacillus dendritiformis]